MYRYRVTLRSALNCESLRHLEEVAVDLRRVDLAHVEEDSTLLVSDEGIILVAVPQLRDRVMERCCSFVFRLSIFHGDTQVASTWTRSGHYIPTSSPMTDVIKARKLSCDMCWFIVTGANSVHQADVFRMRGNSRE